MAKSTTSRTTAKKAKPDPAAEANEAFIEMLSRPRRRKPFVLTYDDNTQQDIMSKVNEVRRLERAARQSVATDAEKAEHETQAAALAALQEETNAIVFDLAQISANEYEALVQDHLCSPEKNATRRKAGEPELLLDPDTFPGALINAVVDTVTMPSGAVMDGITPEQYEALKGGYYAGDELDALFEACVTINKSPVSAALMGKG